MTVERRLTRWFATCLAALLSAAPLPALAGLERVGPTMSSTGFPLWYQDATGITVELCSPTNAEELAGGWCLLLPGDTVAPESFPDAFADEHFYWAADAVGTWSLDGATGGVRLILGLEAAFAVGPVVAGDQLVFGRVRIRIDDLPLSGTYTVYTPYGRYVFPNQVAGDRLFFTEDIGINCTPGNFECALQSSLGPLLLPSDAPGGPELQAVAGPAPGKLYIADPARLGPVTGSPLADYVLPNGETRNANVFRIEGPGGVELFETTSFALVGRLFSGDVPGRVHVDRASYGQTSANRQIDVFATAFPTREPRVPAAPVVDPVAPELAVYPVPCAGVADPTTGVIGPPFSAPADVGSIAMARNGSVYWTQTSPPVVPAGVCLAHTNARNTSGQIAPVFLPAPLTDQVLIPQATFDPNAGTLLVQAFSSDAVTSPLLTLGAFGAVPNTQIDASGIVVVAATAPPSKVRVISDEGGANEMQVTVLASAGVANAAPEAVGDAALTLSNQPVTIDVLTNDVDADGNPLRISGVTQPANGTVQIAGGLAVVYAPAPAFVGADAFTYSVTDERGGFSTASVIVTVDLAPNVAPVANPDAAVTGFQTPITVAVLANDADANGDPLAVTSVSQPAAGGTVAHDAVGVTFTPDAGFSGDASFTYTVEDGRGGSSVGLVVVSVRPAETLVVTLAQFRRPDEWRVSGTSTVNGATVTIHSGPTLDGPVIGTAVVTGGLWTFRSSTTGVPASTRISVESTGGATRLNQVVTIR